MLSQLFILSIIDNELHRLTEFITLAFPVQSPSDIVPPPDPVDVVFHNVGARFTTPNVFEVCIW
jgi:hypothetical protein